MKFKQWFQESMTSTACVATFARPIMPPIRRVKKKKVDEANLVNYQAQQNSYRNMAGQVGKGVGGLGMDMAMDLVPGANVVKGVGSLTYQIINLIKNRKNAQGLISQAMKLPDGINQDQLFNVDDGLIGPNGQLNQTAVQNITKMVQDQLTRMASMNQTPPPRFANDIAIQYLKSKIPSLNQTS